MTLGRRAAACCMQPSALDADDGWLDARMQSQRTLIVATALLEIGSGLVTLLRPEWAIRLLFGVIDASPVALATGRFYGVAILALGVACWCIRAETASPAVRAVLCGMLTYNVGACSVLPMIALTYALSGVLLWPAAVLHGALALWCVAVLRAVALAAPDVQSR
jgi:hypothetical protein